MSLWNDAQQQGQIPVPIRLHKIIREVWKFYFFGDDAYHMHKIFWQWKKLWSLAHYSFEHKVKLECILELYILKNPPAKLLIKQCTSFSVITIAFDCQSQELKYSKILLN